MASEPLPLPEAHDFEVQARRRSTESMVRFSKRRLAVLAEVYPASINQEFPRPRTYGECDRYDFGGGPVALAVDVPCPFCTCRYHGKHEVSEDTGSIKDLFLGVELEDLEPELTCALRLAGRGGMTLEDVGAATGRTRERVRQIETAGLDAMRLAPGVSLEAATEDPIEYLPMIRVRRPILRQETPQASVLPVPSAKPWSREDHCTIFGNRPFRRGAP